MSHYVARVGELIIKPEYRKDFGHMFFAEYDNVKDKGLFNYIAQFEVTPEYSMDFLQLRYWNHNDYKKEWAYKYLTCYKVFTGAFRFYNLFNQDTTTLTKTDPPAFLQAVFHPFTFKTIRYMYIENSSISRYNAILFPSSVNSSYLCPCYLRPAPLLFYKGS